MKNRDLRSYTRQTNVQLVIGALLLLFLVGDGLIYFIYGAGAAITGLICLLGGMVPIVLIIGVMALMDWVVKRANRD